MMVDGDGGHYGEDYGDDDDEECGDGGGDDNGH